jgi:dTDP-4-amino-4,6-dideoxygalactose transaminase
MARQSNNTFYIGRPNIGPKEDFLNRVDGIFEHHWLTNNGPNVKELEDKIADYLGVSNCIAVCNGTIGLQLAAQALNLKGNVLVPAMTFVATPHALQWLGLTPKFVDVDPLSYNINPQLVEASIDGETSGIVGVHLFGQPCQVEALQSIATKHKLSLMFDAAHSFGCSYNNGMIGGFGDCEVFSFHATKVFNTFEGGAITTNNDKLAERLRVMRNFGFEGEDTVCSLGINGKMAEINAAMGLTNLQFLPEFIETNRKNYEQYEKNLRFIEGVDLAKFDLQNINNFHYVIVEVSEEKAGVSRDQLKEMLTKNKVVARRYFYPGCHRMEPYATLSPSLTNSLPATDVINNKILALPTGTQMSASSIDTICELIRNFAGQNK